MEKSYNNIKVSNDNKSYYETDGLVVTRLFLDYYKVFPNVVTLKPSKEICKNKYKQTYFSLNSTLDAFEKNKIDFSIRSVSMLDNEGNLSDQHYAIFMNNFPCIISVDEQHVSDEDPRTFVYDVYYKEFNKDVKQVVDLIWKNSFHIDDIEINKKINFISMTTGGFTLIEKSIKIGDINIEKNYNDGFTEVDKLVDDFVNNDESGLLIFNGEPGTGKSYYIRSLINRCNKQFIFVTQDIVNQMSTPQFISFLMELEDSVLILEDCENIIMSRDGGNKSSAMSNVLNICDGILSDILNIKIIVTFNTNLKNIDKALLRKGRLKYQYEFKKLKADKAKVLLTELYGVDYDVSKVEDMNLADIYNQESNNNENINKTVSIGFK